MPCLRPTFRKRINFSVATSDELGRVGLWVLAAPGFREFESTPVIPYHQFTHVAETFDGNTHRIYVNGVLNTSVNTGPLDSNRGDPDVLIGIRFISGQPYYPNAFKGIIDELQVYNRALTDLEVESIYRSGAAGVCRP